jgi:hypothetical protein
MPAGNFGRRLLRDWGTRLAESESRRNSSVTRAAGWRRGYDAYRQQMTVRDVRIRIDLSVGELMHLGALTHLGFKKVMPSDRGIEMHRFDGEDHALEDAHAVERLERLF